jgi:hypothetical protein
LSKRDLVKRANTVEVGEYLYTWEEAPASVSSFEERAEATVLLARRGLCGKSDDMGVLVVMAGR